MIVTSTKPFGVIKVDLKKTDKISLISCNNCAKLCGTGGQEGIDEIKKDLEKNGYTVCDEFVFSPVCAKNVVRKVAKPKGNVILVLACDAGDYCVKEVFKSKKMIAALETIGLGAHDKEGRIFMVREFK